MKLKNVKAQKILEKVGDPTLISLARERGIISNRQANYLSNYFAKLLKKRLLYGRKNLTEHTS